MARWWRDIISYNAWLQVSKKTSTTASMSKARAIRAKISSSVLTPERLLEQIGTKINAYHAIPKTRLETIDSRVAALVEIADLAHKYLTKFNVDMEFAQKRAKAGVNWAGTQIDKWDKSPYTGAYMFGKPQNESLDRNLLTLKRRAGRKAGYLLTMKDFYNGKGAKFRDPMALLDYLRAPQEKTDEFVGLYGGVRLEAIDFAHRPYEVKFDSNGKVKDGEGMFDPLEASQAFRDWAKSVTTHQTPFFLWLEGHPICLEDDKDLTATTRSVHYVRADKGQAPRGYDKLKLLSFNGGIVKEVSLNNLLATPTICDTTNYQAANRKGGPGTAAFVWTKSYELFIAEHQESYFHHSTFVSGEAVRCAGMIKILNGKVHFVSNNSGHYKPSKTHLKNFLDFLHNKQVINAKVPILCLGANDFDGTVRDFYFQYALL